MKYNKKVETQQVTAIQLNDHEINKKLTLVVNTGNWLVEDCETKEQRLMTDAEFRAKYEEAVS